MIGELEGTLHGEHFTSQSYSILGGGEADGWDELGSPAGVQAREFLTAAIC